MKLHIRIKQNPGLSINGKKVLKMEQWMVAGRAIVSWEVAIYFSKSTSFACFYWVNNGQRNTRWYWIIDNCWPVISTERKILIIYIFTYILLSKI